MAPAFADYHSFLLVDPEDPVGYIVKFFRLDGSEMGNQIVLC